MERDKVIQYLAAMTDDEFHQTAAQARTLNAMSTIDARLAAAQERGDVTASIALKQERHWLNNQTHMPPEGPAQ
jgi:hypothetical protein